MRKNDTHASTTDPDCRFYRKAAGRDAKLCYMGHATMENRHGLAVAGMITPANGTAERRASETMLNAKAKAARHRITVGEDRAYDAANHVANLCAIDHAAQGYTMPQSCWAMTECIFGASSTAQCVRPNTAAIAA